MTRYQSSNAQRPGQVTAIRGVVFQSDGSDPIGRIFIRPMEALDRWIARVLPSPGQPALAMHAGIHIEIDGSREYVAEQLVGSLDMDLRNGLNWTPYEDFKQRDHGSWDVTVPATAFRRIDQAAVDETLAHLNAIQGHPFVGEDCTAFVERAFGGRRLFADSPLLRSFGVGVRVGDPALPLIKREAKLDARAQELLQLDEIKDLPDPLADAEAPNLRVWIRRLVPVLLISVLVGRRLAGAYSPSSRKSTPVSTTARRFFK